MNIILKWIISIVIILTIILGVYFLSKKTNIKISSIKNIEKLQKDTTSHYKDKENINHATRQVITDKDRNAIISFYEDSLKKMANIIGVKENQINQFGQIITSQTERFKPIIKYVDSSKNKIHIQAGDNFISITGIISTKDSSSYIDYKGIDSLNYYFYTTKQTFIQKLFNSPQQTFDVKSKNQKIIIPNISSVIIPPVKESNFKFGIYGGYGLELNNSKIISGPQIGVGIIYKF